MEQKFGEFVREKRLERGLKLKTFAQLIGISAVYESYIENGKRPAPSPLILNRIAHVLVLSPEEHERALCLAELSRNNSDFPEDVWNYIAERPYVYEVLNYAAKNNVGEKQWAVFRKSIEEE